MVRWFAAAQPRAFVLLLLAHSCLLPLPPTPALPAAHGLKFAQSKVAYHSKEIEGVAGRYANPPVAVKESVGQVMDAIRAKFPSV